MKHSLYLQPAWPDRGRKEVLQNYSTRPRGALIHDPRLEPAHLPVLRGGLPYPLGLPVRTGSAAADAKSAAAKSDGRSAFSGAPTRAAITLAGRRALAAGTAANGVHDVWIHPARVVTDFSVNVFPTPGDLASAFGNGLHASTLAPGFLQRSGHALEERVFIPHELGAVIWQWTAQATIALRLNWTVDAGFAFDDSTDMAGAVHWNTGDRWLALHAAKTNRAALYVFDRPVEWIVQAGAGAGPVLRVAASVHVEVGAAITLAATAASPGAALQNIARVLDRTDALVRSRMAAAQRIEGQRVLLRSSQADVTEAWRWELHRLDGLLAETPGLGRSFLSDGAVYSTHNAFHGALAALAVGDFDAARAVIEFLTGKQEQDGRMPYACTSRGLASYDAGQATVQFLLLMARYFAWTGDVTFLRTHWPAVRAGLACVRAADAADTTSSNDDWLVALRELAVVAESIGQPDDALQLRTLQGGHAAQAPAPANNRPRLDGSEPLTISSFMYDVLGIAPDASRHRVELRPTLPADWETVAVENIRIAESSFALSYHREEIQHRFTFTPLSGMVPVRVIFEPAIAAPGIVFIAVDGQPASLNLRRAGDRWLCPMQVVLDHERTIIIEAKRNERARS